MDEAVRVELERARRVAVEARRLLAEAERAGSPPGETARRRRELDRLEDTGRSAVLECLERGQADLAAVAARDLAEALGDEGERAARALVLARRAAEG
jgi:truncated hemoglobin YjbI